MKKNQFRIRNEILDSAVPSLTAIAALAFCVMTTLAYPLVKIKEWREEREFNRKHPGRYL